MLTIQPYRDNILISMHVVSRPDGLVLPEGSSQEIPYGKVLAVGPDVKESALGDRVLFLAQNAIAFNLEPRKVVFIIPEQCIIGKLQGESAEVIPFS